MDLAVRRADAGAIVRPVDIADMLDKLNEATNTVMLYEGARFHEQRFKDYGSRLSELADLARDGLKISQEPYDEAREFIVGRNVRVTE